MINVALIYALYDHEMQNSKARPSLIGMSFTAHSILSYMYVPLATPIFGVDAVLHRLCGLNFDASSQSSTSLNLRSPTVVPSGWSPPMLHAVPKVVHRQCTIFARLSV